MMILLVFFPRTPVICKFVTMQGRSVWKKKSTAYFKGKKPEKRIMIKKKVKKTKKCQPPEADPCRNPGLNQGPLDLQSNALPTELFRLTRAREVKHNQ